MSETWSFQARLSGVFTTIPTYKTPIRVSRGRKPFGAFPSASEFSCEVADDTLQYDPSRPTSLLYGVAGRNTVVRIRPNNTTRLWGEATWEPQRTPDHVPGVRGRSAVNVTAAGLLRRLESWTDPLRSPMFRTISGRTTSTGHWPMEEGSGATRLSNTLPGGVGGKIQGGADLGNSDAPAGAASSARIADGSRLAGTFVTMSTTAGWQVSWAFRAAAMPPSATYVEMFRIVAANGYTWIFYINNGSWVLFITDSDGNTLLNATYTFGAGTEPTNWINMRVAVQQVGGNVSINWAWYPQDLNTFWIATESFAGSISRPTRWEQLGNATTDGWFFCHVFGVTGLTDDLMSTTSRRVFNGYRGENTYARYARLLAEAGLTRFVLGDSAFCTLMGPQKPGTMIDLLKECRDTEDGETNDERFDIALTFVTRRYLYHRTPVLTLTRGQLSTYTKVIGTTGVANRVTVRNADGGEYTASLETGSLSVQPPPAGVGEIRKQVDVSVSDTGRGLRNMANWHLAKGTLDVPRYTSIVVDLVATPSLVSTAGGVREGDWITVDDVEPDTVRLIVVGIEETQSSGTHLIEFLTEPADVFDVGVWDSFKWGTNLSFLSGDHAVGDNTLALTTDSRHGRWSTSFTGDLVIAGERVTVLSMGAASGSGPYTQTATVTRGVNGMEKLLPGGSQVKLFRNKKWGL